ncbi:hypothetical protein DID88_009666 [Monilinia fructigena]|uniref:Uncharacterized protein n=1 Tax=Monilinia fructigena TaxID=38457 RepID=A0A395IFA8_9HELO|nr:hypothetical protein DID88_009666 [Monilinia fructigena]
MPPKNPGGRPKKYATKAEAKAADLEKRQYRRQQARLPAGPADFIAFEPPHPDVPTDTPPSGLRTSSGIRIPADSNVQSSDVPQNLRPISPPPTQLPPFDEDAEVAAQIKQIQVDEQEVNLERGEYEAEIAEILIGLRSANAAEEARTGGRGSPGKRPMEGSNTVGEGEDARNEEPQRSCSSQIASVDEPIMTWDNDSTAASNTSNRPASIQRSRRIQCRRKHQLSTSHPSAIIEQNQQQWKHRQTKHAISSSEE